jgi:hypothetical protein
MKSIRLLLLATASVSALLLAGCGPKNPVELDGLLVAIREVRTSMAAAANQVDQATANRITQVDVVAKTNIDRLEKVIAQGANATAVQREEAARQALNMLADAQRIVDASGKSLFGNLNESLAGASAVVAGIPFSDMQETVFALSPLKIARTTGDRQVTVHAYLPTLANAPERVSVMLDDKPVRIERGIGKFTFDLPAAPDKQLFSTLKISIRKPWWHVFADDPAPLTARIRYVNEQPFRFIINADQDNPAAFVDIKGAPHHSTANSDNVFQTPVFSAASLFRLTVPNLEKYEPDTATLIGVDKDPASAPGKPCASCPEPTGNIVSWAKESVTLALAAPECKPHMVTPGLPQLPWRCNGGGSNYNMVIVPTFHVRTKGAPNTVPVWNGEASMRHRAVSELNPPAIWTSMLVKMKYDDAIDQFEEVAFLTKGVPTGTANSFAVRVNEGSLVISTR